MGKTKTLQVAVIKSLGTHTHAYTPIHIRRIIEPLDRWTIHGRVEERLEL
jgi:hypothetical protein